MKKNFIIHCDSLSVIDKMTDEQVGKLFRKMRSYHNWNTYDPEDVVVDIAFEQFKNQFDRDKEKYKSVCERNAENWKKWWRPPKTKENPKNPSGLSWNPKKPKKADSDSDSDNKSDSDKEKNNKEIVSKDTTDGWFSPKPITQDIDNVISEIKNKMSDYWIVYSWDQERMFGKHILSKKWNNIASQYKFNDWLEFAKFVIDCSMQDWNWRKYKVCSIKLLYQKYAQIINSYQEAKDKKSNIVSSF